MSLHDAAWEGDVPALQRLIADGHNVNDTACAVSCCTHTTPDLSRLLMAAAVCGRVVRRPFTKQSRTISLTQLLRCSMAVRT